VKKIILIALVALFLSVAGSAVAGGPYPYYAEEPYYYDAPPYNTIPKIVYVPKVVYVPADIRIKIAELERLKSEIHYRALSCYPADLARASWLADKVVRLNYEIEAWRRGYW
jgi:hypothetical protein